MAEADGSRRPQGWRASHAPGLLASETAEALPNLDPAQLPWPSEGPERTSVLRACPYHGAGSQGQADQGPQWLSLREGKGLTHPLLLRALGQADISAPHSRGPRSEHAGLTPGPFLHCPLTEGTGQGPAQAPAELDSTWTSAAPELPEVHFPACPRPRPWGSPQDQPGSQPETGGVAERKPVQTPCRNCFFDLVCVALVIIITQIGLPQPALPLCLPVH